MASSKVMPSTNPGNSDHQRRPSHPPSSTIPSPMISDFYDNSDRPAKNSNGNDYNLASSASVTVDGLLSNVYGRYPAVFMENNLLDTKITLIDAAGAISAVSDCEGNNAEPSIGGQNSFCSSGVLKTFDDVWREIVAGRSERIELKEDAPEEMMTLEDFLARARAVVEEDVKAPVSDPTTERLSGGVFAFDPIGQSPYSPQEMVQGPVVGFENALEEIGGVRRGKRRSGPALETLDKTAQQRQRRMIKNRESAARSRERKQAYQVELESLAARLEEENELLLKEKVDRTKERFKQLMEKVIPVVEKRRPVRALMKVRSVQW
ncbi:hypothetical protein Nepgr_002855 [Nepenthes gracilis]|uniref:BZIP domain-containing protein n=1 Tax=Nepenthes gracilis TaxID=150966 RepID=A0AAD3P701_NEPGR|nr:hypothetical protein Nepgr_002855 [Nepenthes gracilis]